MTAALSATVASAQKQPEISTGVAKLAFIGGDMHDFANISDQKDVDYSFSFKNPGGASIIILAVPSPCGCTITEFPKEPIQPGKTGKIKVTFHPAGKSGAFYKTFSVHYTLQNADVNDPGEYYQIYIKGVVVPGI